MRRRRRPIAEMMGTIREYDIVVDYWLLCQRCREWVRTMGREIGQIWTDGLPPGNVRIETVTCPCGHTVVAVPPTYERLL